MIGSARHCRGLERFAMLESTSAEQVASPAIAPSGGDGDVKVGEGRVARPGRRWRKWVIGGAALGVVLIAGALWLIESWGTVSTEDAYVNGHVTLVAPRVSGQVARVLVEDNNRVRKGDLLVQLDPEPYRVQFNIAEAGVAAAESDLRVAEAQARAIAGQTRAARYNLEHAIQEVDNQVALLRSKVAALASQRASLDKAKSEYDRALVAAESGTVSKQDMEIYKEAFLVGQARVEEALQGVYQVRVSLGLSPRPERGDDLTQVPDDLDQTFSAVKQAQMSLVQAVSPLGATDSLNKSPRQMLADFLKRDPDQDIDRIYAELIKNAPAVKQAEAKRAQANRLLEQAKLNLSYCDVVAEIDGVVTRRSVNPGNNVVAGQGVMAVRSLTEIWVDANFKETQLAELRIGQPVDVEVDMYGGRQRFKGRVSGFTMGTGSTLALLPAENATGNFVKVVQRLPVRIELMDYNPDRTPLFVGLSVTPRVHVNESPTGPDAGKVLQPGLATTRPALPG
jgi:membrane fusion protein (multidrug efflux system)